MTSQTMKVNYKSDFSFRLTLKDALGKLLPPAGAEFTLELFTSGRGIYVPTWHAEPDGSLTVVCDSHGLDCGKLRGRLTLHLPDTLYPDDEHTEVVPFCTDITLTTGATEINEASAELALPLVKGDQGDKGDPLTYADLTEAEKADLAPLVAEDTDTEADDILPGVVQSAVRFTEQALTPGERAQALKNLGEPEMMLFIDMFNEAAGDDGYARMVNGVFDCKLNEVQLTYEEAIGVYASYPLCKHQNVSRQQMFAGVSDRTLFPINTNSFFGTNYIEAFVSSSKLVAVKFRVASNNPIVNISNGQNMFKDCRSLKYIYNTLVFAPNANIDGALDLCPALEEVRIKKMARSLRIAESPKLSLESIQYLVTNAANTSAITVTLHPSAFARLTDDLIAAAQAKNISFVTP